MIGTEKNGIFRRRVSAQQGIMLGKILKDEQQEGWVVT